MPRFAFRAAPVVLVALAAARAGEVQTPNPLVAVYDGQPGQDDPAAKIRIVGTLGGAFTGQAVVYGAPPRDAKVSDLKRQAGGVIPAAAVSISYALPTLREGRKGVRFDALSAAPRPDGATHPVWLTVNVPADAAPGDYEGGLSIDGRKVPVSLKVCGWRLPQPIEFRTMVGLVQSPDTVALYYHKESWSEEHFKLIGKTFDQLGRVGNKVIVIPLIARTNFGNEESMVRWIKDGDEFKHDFTIAEKYLDLYIERVGKPQAVIFYVYEPLLGGGHGRTPEELGRGVLVSALDPASGKVSTLQGPCLNHPVEGYKNYPEGMKNFWKPVLDGMHERLAKRGLGDETFMLGISGDLAPGKNTIDNLKAIAPYARWSKQGHGYAREERGMPVGYHTYVWSSKAPPDPAQKRFYGWQKPRLEGLFPREGVPLPVGDGSPPGVYRGICEAALTGDARGIGRVGADFWGVLGDKEKRGLVSRYPLSSWSQLNMTNAVTRLLAPGPEGAVPTVRFEQFREGVQACEARTFIEQALTDKALAARLGTELAGKCQEVLDNRVVQLRAAFADRKAAKGWDWFAAESGWQALDGKLFDCAEAVARALGSK